MSMPEDAEEREADRVAGRVSGDSGIQRKCACSGEAGPDDECADCKAKSEGLIPRRANGASTGVSPSVQRALAGTGQPLGSATRALMEDRFGADFGAVRVHTGAPANRAARDLRADAFTTGQGIYFGAGRYQPDTQAGQRLLAHELTHTVQQRSLQRGVMRMEVSAPGDEAEQEAETIAHSVAAGERIERRIAGRPAPIQRYSWDEFVGDVGDVGEAIAGGASAAAGAVSDAASAAAGAVSDAASAAAGAVSDVASAAAGAVGEAVDWLATTAGQAALDAANALAGLFGGSVVIRGGCLIVTIPEIPLFPSFQKTLGETPPYGFFIPIIAGGTMVGPIPLAGTFGILGYAQGSIEGAIGPGMVRGIRVEICPFSGRYMATGQLYAAAAIAPRLTLFGGLAAAAGTIIPFDPPIPVIVILQGGLRGTGTGWFIGAIQDTVTLAYSGGTLSFDNVTDLMGGVLLQGDVDLFAALRLYEKIICQYVYPLGHWETGAAWKLTIPIHAGLSGSGGTGGVGPITFGPMPIQDIVTAIQPLATGLDCLSWEEIKQFLCENGVLPPELCQEEEGEQATGLAGSCVANDNLGEMADSFIGRCCQASIRREFPGEMLNETLGNIKRGTTARHKKAWKLLNDNRFKKPGAGATAAAGKVPSGRTKSDAIPVDWFKPLSLYPDPIVLSPSTGGSHEYEMQEPDQFVEPGHNIGVQPAWIPKRGKKMRLEKVLQDDDRGPAVDRFRSLLQRHGYPMTGEDADHVQDLGWGGPDGPDNLWPLNTTDNQAAGRAFQNFRITYAVNPGEPARPETTNVRLGDAAVAPGPENVIGRFFVIGGFQRP